MRSASYPEGVSSDDVGVDAGTGPGAGARHPDLDRTAGAAGVVTYVTAGLLPLLTGSAMPALWWALWVGGLPVFVALVLLPLGRTAAIALLGAGAVIAAGLFVANPLFGFGAVPMVLVAAIAGLVLQLRAALVLVAALTVVLVAVGTRDELGIGALSAVFYVALMLFAAVTGQVARREMQAREELSRVHEDLSRAHAELSRAHAQLEAAQARLAERSRNDERLRISRDLHDLVGHQLSALAVNLEVASHLAEGRAAEHVERARAAAKDLLGDVRDVVGRLREPQGELRAVLADMAAAFPRPDVRLTVADDLGDVAPDAAEALVRCVQEILTNAVRHSGARTVRVDVAAQDGSLVVDAHDDGHGAADVRPGNGLTGMRERVAALGGSMDVDGGGAGRGFAVRLRIPAGETS